MSSTNTIPMFKVAMSTTAKNEVGNVLDSGMIGEGPKVVKFTKALNTWFKHDKVVCTNSCTSSLMMALKLAMSSSQNSVLTTPFTMVATNCAITNTGNSVIWGKVSNTTLCLDCDEIIKTLKANKQTFNIVMLVLVGGVVPFRLNELVKICKKKNIPLILDAAHGVDTLYKNKHISHWGDYVCFSFQSIKHLTTGDGGALAINCENNYQRAIKLKWFGIDRKVPKGMDRLEHQMTSSIQEAGYKFHMNDIAASIGLANLKLAKQSIAVSRENVTLFKTVIPSEYQIITDVESNPSWWTFGFVLNNTNINIDKCNQVFKDANIQTTPMWPDNTIHNCFPNGTCQIHSKIHPVFIPSGFWVVGEFRERIYNTLRKLFSNHQ